MRQTRFTRRRMLEGAAALAVAGLAGCTSSGSPGSSAAATTQTESGGDPPGHGESDHSHDTVSKPKQAREVLVNTARGEDTNEYHFKPHVTWIEVGGTVTWRLESGTHTATAYHPDNDQPRLVPDGTEAWDSGTMSETGETFEHTFDTEGVYHYLCTPHEQFGMIATVIVGQPHLDDQRALQGMPDNKPEEVHGKLQDLNTMVQEIMGEGHHDEDATEDGHHDEEATEDGHHEEDDGHHEGGTETESGHHEEETHTEDGHHEGDTSTEEDHHDEGDGHHEEGTETEDGHHDETTTER